MTKLPELLPCPFCNSVMQVAKRHAILCLECYASGPQGEDRKAAWNTRTPAPAVQALVEAARALQIDMLERAQMKIDAIHGEQYRIVNAGNSAWGNFCAALAAFDKTD